LVKTVIVTLSVTIPDTEMSKNATVTVGTATYLGKITGIITHEDTSIPSATTVKITGLGLAVVA